MTTVVVFCISEKLSGGEHYTLDLLEALINEDVPVVLVGRVNSPLQSAAIARGIPFEGANFGPKLGKRTLLKNLLLLPRNLVELSSILSKYPRAIFVLQYKLEQLLAAVLMRGRNYIFLEHGAIPSLITRFPLARYLYSYGVQGAKVVFSASQPATSSLNAFNISPVPLVAGIKSSRRESAEYGRKRARDEMESLTGASQIGVFAGRITEEKGVLEAARLIGQIETAGFLIWGTGPALKRLQSEIEGNSRIRYMGMIDDALPYIAAADFGVLLTRDVGEGRPLFAVECAAVGTPVVAMSSSPAMLGVQDEFGDDVVRLLDLASVEEFKSAIQQRPTPSLAQTWSESGRLFITEAERATGLEISGKPS